MKKRLIFTLLLAAFIVACFAQKPYKVVFYNFENLFDTIHDPGVLDEEFTPEGPKKWNTAKYTKKLGNLERVLFDIAAEDKDYASSNMLVWFVDEQVEEEESARDMITACEAVEGNKFGLYTLDKELAARTYTQASPLATANA